MCVCFELDGAFLAGAFLFGSNGREEGRFCLLGAEDGWQHDKYIYSIYNRDSLDMDSVIDDSVFRMCYINVVYDMDPSLSTRYDCPLLPLTTKIVLCTHIFQRYLIRFCGYYTE